MISTLAGRVKLPHCIGTPPSFAWARGLHPLAFMGLATLFSP